jgi:hypothetical protein
MAISWERVAGPLVVTNVDTLLYTVATRKKLVVRSIEVCETAASAGTAARVGIGGTTDALCFVRSVLSASQTTFLNDLRVVLYAGETIHAKTINNNFTLTIHGFLIDV